MGENMALKDILEEARRSLTTFSLFNQKVDSVYVV